MKRCQACGDDAMIHTRGIWVCLACRYEEVPNRGNRRHERRYKRVLGRLDRIGARLAGLR